ncbi:MAG: DNA ligase [Desulfobulbaceae bacterium]|nr:DNA ligase [Desulfobulbaceae bacterium]
MLKRVALFLLLFAVLTLPARGLEIMLPQVYEGGLELSGWLMSEKLDGVRGYWDGRQLFSRNGLPFQPPPEFPANFPDFPIEGELWGGRGTFEQTVSVVRRQEADPGWLTLKFAIFDAPTTAGGFETRLARVSAWFARHPAPHAFVIEHAPVGSAAHLQGELARIEQLGGEGLILRKSDSPYNVGRSPDILKVKSYADREGLVVEQIFGEGDNKDRLSSLLVELPDSGIRFKIGTGFTDQLRRFPPPVGATITFKYFGYYESGVPRFPSYLRAAFADK